MTFLEIIILVDVLLILIITLYYSQLFFIKNKGKLLDFKKKLQKFEDIHDEHESLNLSKKNIAVFLPFSNLISQNGLTLFKSLIYQKDILLLIQKDMEIEINNKLN